ncbi:hypothetical protein RJ639_013010 [Escallonia herrerae]|uniref:Uncharacterized protein n=1 Tax=Escallonia herrerae TaxID=1293975 RepID=A0AA88VPG7_9ASTE|nr:hypothetical protein RJ639_013010 [Escallonia herrerae]
MEDPNCFTFFSVAQKRISISKVVNAMKKRESSFKAGLWAALRSLIVRLLASYLFTNSKNGPETAKFLSLEDLLVSKAATSAGGKDAKRTRMRQSVASSSQAFEELCHQDCSPLLPAEIVEHLRSGIGSQGQMVHLEEIGGRKANYVEIPGHLSENTRSLLQCYGITKLYSHQAEAIQASLAGKNVVVATMTSSGKSLCYNLPVLEVLSQNLLACALYLFPTKALAQDQLRALVAMTRRCDASLNIGIYDGDTYQHDRLWLRDNARLLITNPDMLHMSILPFHGQFRRILTNLRFIVIDEAHAYKGAFGCHTALILRRVHRLCAHVYGSNPSFISCTATSANPREHSMVRFIIFPEQHGATIRWKSFGYLLADIVRLQVTKRSKRSVETNKSASKNVVVGRSRWLMHDPVVSVFAVQLWRFHVSSQKLFSTDFDALHSAKHASFVNLFFLIRVRFFRRQLRIWLIPFVLTVLAILLRSVPQDRRKIESNFFGGNLRGVAATNALELGIDVGHIDVTLHLGFPGSIASLWQQAGRSGRREKPSLAIYVAFEGPLDQYFMKFPEKLFRSPIECCHVDAKNQQVLEQHLVCAALEHPLSLLHDDKYFGPGLKDAIRMLKNKGYLATYPSCDSSAGIWSYIGQEKMPSHAISIRAIESERYKVIDKQKNEVLEEIEESKAFFQVYEGAVYMNQGKTYLVNELDLSTKIALCQEADLKYYTKTRDYTDIDVIGGNIAYPARISNVQFSRTSAQIHICKITTTWFGYRCIWRGSNQVFDTVELSLPSHSYESQAAWISVSQSVKAAVEMKNYSFRGGLHAAGHALLNVVPLFIICNSSDLASECINPHDSRYIPERILLYDPHPGGTGISSQVNPKAVTFLQKKKRMTCSLPSTKWLQVQPLFTELLNAALELLTSCCCSGDTGCPKCVQNLACHEYNEVLHKEAAMMIIKGVLSAEKSYFEGIPDSARTS